ncbi:conserved hypothetical protein [Methylobacterium sp. 4-46]|uniref:hypothetical protein n=1 Tax=unclassified Methylobacterium TaxID=2615210 RepID=UPI000165CCC8|nr:MULTISPECIES: hypothetical protein [Methylobacterium]ACA20674.1 conserved hypothetical protein [Methylobacterium sp. 4-46]WFT79831.1 hypothetical protein QA634_32385 [Methylobacterium nodulans]
MTIHERRARILSSWRASVLLASLGLSAQNIQAAPEAKHEPNQSRPKEGASGDDQQSRKDKKDDVDTEHLFGFTEGADASEKGHQEVIVDTIGRFSKRRDGPGFSTYRVFDTRIGYQFNPIDQLSIEFSTFGTFHHARNIIDVDNKSFGNFDGLAVDVKYQFLKADDKQPLNAAFEVRPRFTRVLPIEGRGADIVDVETLLQVDMQVVKDKVWYATNISFEPTAGRERGSKAGYRSSTFLWSNAVVARIAEKTFLGPEVRYLRGYEGTFLNRLESEALFIGPALHHRFTEHAWVTVAYAGQVWGRDTDPSLANRAFGLSQFERHNMRVKLGLEF